MVKRSMSLTYNGKTVRQHDPDRFLLSLIAPARHRAALWTLFAFNYEIAKTREVVSETTIGLIRLQWWRDAIAEIYDGKTPRAHEVVTPLAEVIRDYDLDRELFDKLIYAREFDLEGVAPANMEGLLNYCDFTTTPLTQLMLDIVQQDADVDVIKEVSVNYALIGLIRSAPYLLSIGHMMLPQDMLGEQGLSKEKLIDSNGKNDISGIVKACLNESSPLHKPSSKQLRSMQKLTQLYRNQITKYNYDVFDSRLSIAPPFKELRVLLT